MYSFIQKRCLRSLAQKEFDYIVVGGGSAGCVLANRLSENNNVLLVEAGPYDKKSLFVHTPALMVVGMVLPKVNWYYNTSQQKKLNNRRLYYPRGRVLGGSSQLNAMCYIRGQPKDYDRWADLTGCDKFKYDNVLPVFKKSQNAVGYGDDNYNGRDGYLKVSKSDLDVYNFGDLTKAFIKAGTQIGYPEIDDPNGPSQEGFGNYPVTVFEGVRQSTSTAFIRPIEDRLTVMTHALASKLIMDNNLVTGLEVVDSNRLRRSKKIHRFYAKEVILAGGTINTPQLLQLSGIGPKADLEKAGVECKIHSPGVGKNLQDHLQFDVIHKCRLPITLHSLQFRILSEWLKWKRNPETALLGSNCLAGFGFEKLYDSDDVPGIQHHLLASPAEDHGRKMTTYHGFADHVYTLRQYSRGQINIKTKNPHDAPIIDPNALSHPEDLPGLVAALKKTREVIGQPAMEIYRGEEMRPGMRYQTDDEIANWLVNDGLVSCYHPTSTCRIGVDDQSPVDTDFRVKGVDGLRVADASVMPDLIAGNTNAPSIMLAELCSQDVLNSNK